MKLVTGIFILVCLMLGCSPKMNSYPVKSGSVTYKTVDTFNLNLYFINPPGFNAKRKYPVLIFFYGGGWLNGDINQFERQAKYFASRGLITVLAEYRIFKLHHSTPFDAVADAKSAIRYLRIHSDSLRIDAAKIIAGGGSAGGHLAAAADLTQLEAPGEDQRISSRPNALVLFNPVFDNGPGGYGHDRIGERYPLISPLHNIKRGAAPSIVFFGTDDNLVPVSVAELYKKKMEEKGNRCELFLYQNQKHGFFNNEQYFFKTVRQSDIFLRSLGYLKGRPTVTSATFKSIESKYGYKSN